MSPRRSTGCARDAITGVCARSTAGTVYRSVKAGMAGRSFYCHPNCSFREIYAALDEIGLVGLHDDIEEYDCQEDPEEREGRTDASCNPYRQARAHPLIGKYWHSRGITIPVLRYCDSCRGRRIETAGITRRSLRWLSMSQGLRSEFIRYLCRPVVPGSTRSPISRCRRSGAVQSVAVQ